MQVAIYGTPSARTSSSTRATGSYNGTGGEHVCSNSKHERHEADPGTSQGQDANVMLEDAKRHLAFETRYSLEYSALLWLHPLKYAEIYFCAAQSPSLRHVL